MESPESFKWSREARYVEPMEDKKVRCRLCPHNCIVPDGHTGICQSRINRNGVLYTLTYGNPCSLAMDPIEKKPLFHFLPGSRILSLSTAGCNFHCRNCQNWRISQTSPRLMEHYDMEPCDLVKEALRQKADGIAFTYTEPTIFFEYMFDIARLSHENGLKTVMVSNGYINREPLKDLCPYLDAANIDLKCFSDDDYIRLAGGRLQSVLETLKLLKERGVWLEITTLLIPGWSDKQEMIHRMCRWLVENGFSQTPLHFSRFFPNFRLLHLPPTDESQLTHAVSIAVAEGMKHVYIGNFPLLNGENTYCPSCRRLLIERNGFLITKNLVGNGECPFCGEKIGGVFSVG